MNPVKVVLLVVMALVAVGCATKQEMKTVNASTEWRLKSLEESFLDFREELRRQSDQNAQNAEAVNDKLTMLEEQMAALKNDQDVVVPVTDDALTGELTPEDAGWVEGQKSVDATPAAQSDEEKPWAEVPGSPPVVPEPTVIERKPKKVTMPEPATQKRATSSAGPAKAMYDIGLNKYYAEDFEGARGAFDEFLKKYPKDGLVANALYWKGETYYSQKDYAQAILTFKEVTGRFPKHAKAAASLLKIGMSYDKVGDKDNAVFYLRALVEDFPKSQPASMGRKELQRLGG